MKVFKLVSQGMFCLVAQMIMFSQFGEFYRTLKENQAPFGFYLLGFAAQGLSAGGLVFFCMDWFNIDPAKLFKIENGKKDEAPVAQG